MPDGPLEALVVIEVNSVPTEYLVTAFPSLLCQITTDEDVNCNHFCYRYNMTTIPEER